MKVQVKSVSLYYISNIVENGFFDPRGAPLVVGVGVLVATPSQVLIQYSFVVTITWKSYIMLKILGGFILVLTDVSKEEHAILGKYVNIDH